MKYKAIARSKLTASTTVRAIALAVILVASGVACGALVGYPVSAVNFGTSDAIQLDDIALSGSFDIETALVDISDLPETYQEIPAIDGNEPGAPRLLDSPFCGQQATVADKFGVPSFRTFLDENNNALVFSEAVKVSNTRSADAYIRDVGESLKSCPDDRFFRAEEDGRSEFKIQDDRTDPPIVNYVSRVLVPVDGGTYQVVTYFQAGDAVIALQYAGPTRPTNKFLAELELDILSRIDPNNFSKSEDIEGLESLPQETTTTSIDPAAPSPTSSPDTLPLPPVTAPPEEQGNDPQDDDGE